MRFQLPRELKVPHMGWNQVHQTVDHPVYDGIPDNACFYFVHSYYPKLTDDSLTIGVADYGIRFTAAFNQDNLTATQFHPEKSGAPGLRLLSNFLEKEL